LKRLGFAFRAFFAILFKGSLAQDIAEAFGYVPRREATRERPAAPTIRVSDGALQMLGILQRDARLIDFLMEDISGYTDEQVGAAVRNLHEQSRESLRRYVELSPVIDGVEGTYANLSAAGSVAKDPNAIKLLGNVPANGEVVGGTLRHRGWRALRIELPPLASKQDPSILAPAEIEIE